MAAVTASPQVVVAPQTPAQWKEFLVENGAKLIVKDLNEVFKREMDSLAELSDLPEGAVKYPLREARSADDKVPGYALRPKRLLEQNTSKTLASDLEKLTKPQASLYGETLARCIRKIRGFDQLLLSLNLMRCEPGIFSEPNIFDYNKSNILKSKVVAAVLKAPPKALAYFQ